MMMRIEPADDSLDAFVVREPNAAEGGVVPVFTVSKSTHHQFVELFDHDAALDQDIIVRLNQAEQTLTGTASTALDSTESVIWNIGRYVPVGDYIKGVMSIHLIAFSILSKDWTDTHYDNVTDGAFVSFTAEEGV